jgi:hypothetical protein
VSLDDPPNYRHAQMVENPDDPEWLKIAKRQARGERAAREREELELAASESVEAEEARWEHRFLQRAREIPAVHYDQGPG